MKPKILYTLITVIALLIFAGVVLADNALAQDAAPQGVQSPEAAVDTAFTYQGRLKNASGPMNGKCDVKFDLYNASTGGAPLKTETKTNVIVSDGYFSVSLDFGNDAFEGDARWMGISVACPTGGTLAPLTGRVALNAAPYAHSLRPGATVSSNATTGAVIRGVSSATSGDSAGLYGESNSAGGAGVSGFNLNSTGGYGVYGLSTNGYGVYSVGKAHVEGNLTWKAKTSYISVPPAAFQPRYDGYDFHNPGVTLVNENDTSDYYSAPVQLPHGATVTKLTFYWVDDSADEDGEVRLYQTDLDGSENTMAVAHTNGDSPNADDSEDTSIVDPTIDNSQHAYYLWLILDDSEIQPYGVVIEYTITEPY